MKFCNLIGCILTFPVWFGGNCMWNCILAPCAMGLEQLNKSSFFRMIFVLIVICPILAIVGVLHWLCGIPKTVNAMGNFMDSSPESGFRNLVMPESHNEIIDETHRCLDKVFRC